MVKAVLNILRTYPTCDIERKSDKQIIRKNINPSELTEELLKSYATLHGDLVLVPKRLQGNAPYRQENDAITLTRDSLLPPAPAPMLSGFDNYPSLPSGSGDMYKIMYEREREEAKEYKRKYEDTLTELRRNEIELAGKKPDVIGDVVKSLAGFAPMFMGGGGGGALSLGATPQQEQKQPTMQPISDKRLSAIIGYWPKIDEALKDSLYKIVAAVLTNPENADAILSLLEEQETNPN